MAKVYVWENTVKNPVFHGTITIKLYYPMIKKKMDVPKDVKFIPHSCAYSTIVVNRFIHVFIQPL